MRPLTLWELRELQKSLRVMEVYNSNAIEGNTLTLGETRLVIEDGLTIGGKTTREMHEAEGLARAIDALISGELIVSEDTILMFHRLIMRGIDDENAGRYRQIQVYISWDDHRPPRASEVSWLMQELIVWYSSSLDKVSSSPLLGDELERSRRLGGVLHPTLLASEFHYRFVKIHPFVDGNGRTARLISNLILMSHGYPMIIIPIVRRADYISSLHSVTGSLDRFQAFYADIVHENLRDYIRMVSE
jgi:Fic family protein